MAAARPSSAVEETAAQRWNAAAVVMKVLPSNVEAAEIQSFNAADATSAVVPMCVYALA